MANLSSGPTQKRPGERDAGEDDASQVAAKRSRRESPVGDWRDVHLKERERDRDRGGYDRRGPKRRDDDYHHHSSSRRDRESGREREYRRRRSRSRSRSRSKTPPPPPAAVAPDDDEKEEGEISPRPSVPPSVKPASRRESPSRYGHPSSRHGHDSRRRGDYRNRRSRSRTRSARSRSRSVSTRARSRSPSRARYGSSFAKNRGGSASRKESGYQDKGRVDKDKDVDMHDGTSATSATTSTLPAPANQGSAPPPVSEEIKESEEDGKSIEDKLAERRRKRAEILAKHASGQSSTTVGGASGTAANGLGGAARATPGAIVSEALAKVTMTDGDGKPQPPRLQTPTTPVHPSKGVTATPGAAPQSRRESASPPPPSATAEFDLAKLEGKDHGPSVKEGDVGEEGGEGGGIGAADYDPSLDRREDEKRRFGIDAPPGEGAAHKDENAMIIDGDDGEVEEVEVTDDEDDGEEEVDDMFAIAFGGDEDEEKEKKKEKVKKKKKVKKPQPAPLIPHLVDSAADAEGYYTIILGEYLDNGRYQVFSSLGKGMFANVVRARVLKEEDPTSGELVDVSGGGEGAGGGVEGRGLREVAIKIVRCQEPMYKAGLKEAQILQKLRAMDQEDKKHVVKLERTFEHRGHLCLVFESLSMNLREVVKRFGKDVGLNIKAVRAYAHQLFLSLSLLKKANVMHADIKPDNILVNEQKTLLKLCDLGSASDASENDVTPYLVSRFYRAPEIILGVPYDPSLDIWSIGCTLYELYTGKILFPGRSNSHMLLLMMEVKGRFNSKMIKRAKFGDKYFDSLGNLLPSALDDGATFTDESAASRSARLSSGKPVRDLKTKILGGASVKKMKEEEVRVLTSFVDLLEKCLTLDPGRRITPREALVHPFIRG